jgi:hypothetical protein
MMQGADARAREKTWMRSEGVIVTREPGQSASSVRKVRQAHTFTSRQTYLANVGLTLADIHIHQLGSFDAEK